MKPNNIVVKTEHQVEKCLGIKHENESYTKRMATNGNKKMSAPQSKTNKWVQEKQSLIEKISTLKSENQQQLFDLKKTQKDSKAMANENRMLKEKLVQDDQIHLNQLGQLQAELAKSKAAQKVMNDGHLKRISDLKREKDSLQAQFKQLQNGFAQRSDTKEENEADDDEHYEVERLLDDELVQTRQLFVRWKGYDSSHDSWVFEKDLNCPRMLKRYDQLKKKK